MTRDEWKQFYRFYRLALHSKKQPDGWKREWSAFWTAVSPWRKHTKLLLHWWAYAHHYPGIQLSRWERAVMWPPLPLPLPELVEVT